MPQNMKILGKIIELVLIGIVCLAQRVDAVEQVRIGTFLAVTAQGSQCTGAGDPAALRGSGQCSGRLWAVHAQSLPQPGETFWPDGGRR